MGPCALPLDRGDVGSLRLPEGTFHYSSCAFSSDPTRQDVVDVDTSDSGLVRCCRSEDWCIRSEISHAFFSCRLSPAKQSYDVGHRELLALVLALQECLAKTPLCSWDRGVTGAACFLPSQVAPRNCVGLWTSIHGQNLAHFLLSAGATVNLSSGYQQSDGGGPTRL